MTAGGAVPRTPARDTLVDAVVALVVSPLPPPPRRASATARAKYASSGSINTRWMRSTDDDLASSHRDMCRPTPSNTLCVLL